MAPVRFRSDNQEVLVRAMREAGHTAKRLKNGWFSTRATRAQIEAKAWASRCTSLVIREGPGGARAGAGRPPDRGEAATRKLTVYLTPAEEREIMASAPSKARVNTWLREAALMWARRTS